MPGFKIDGLKVIKSLFIPLPVDINKLYPFRELIKKEAEVKMFANTIPLNFQLFLGNIQLRSKITHYR